MTWKAQITLLTAIVGAGKSAVAHTIAYLCEKRGTLLSSFFFKAGETTSPAHLWSGVARSLAIRNESHRATLTSILENDPGIATAEFDEQFRRLVVKPLRLHPPSSSPLIVVIDALDECEKGASEVLMKLLRDGVSELPRTVKFFVTSRHTKVLDRSFLPDLSAIHHVKIQLSDGNNRRDCEAYIRSEVSKLKSSFPAIRSGWPPELQRRFVVHARGLFIWASAVIHYLKIESANPIVALEDLLDEHAPRDDVPAEEQLDSLYTAILKKCNWRDRAFKHNFPIVMGAIVAAKSPLSMAAWDALLLPLLFPKTSVRDTVSELRPLLTGIDQPSTSIELLHQSFRDYLEFRMTRDRVPTTLESAKDHEHLALRCFQIINTEIPKVADLGMIEKLGEKDAIPAIPQGEVSEQLGYACLFGLDHTLEAKDLSEVSEVEIKTFLEGSIIRNLCPHQKIHFNPPIHCLD